MKLSSTILFIMTALSFNLNAFENQKVPGLSPGTVIGTNDINSPEFKKMEEFIKKAKEEEKLRGDRGKYLLQNEDIQRDSGPCIHCPKYLALTSQINQIVEKMGKNPATYSDELPVKLNRLKFLFYTQKKRAADGSSLCQRYMDTTLDARPTKFDGQFKLIADEVFKFGAVTDVQLMNPDSEETVYYYRGEGAEKDLIIQVIMTKDGSRLRYYRYFPTEKEQNPYNLPDLDKVYPSEAPRIIPIVIAESNSLSPRTRGISFLEYTSEEEKRQSKAAFEENKRALESGPNEGDTSLGSLLGKGSYGFKLKADVEKRNKYIPKNVHFLEASADQEIIGGLSMKANSDLSLKGNEARFSLKKDASDLVVVELMTKLNGQTEHKVIVPFSVALMDGLPGVRGRAETNSNGQVLNLSLTDAGVDLVRSELRRNATTGVTSYVLARDIAMSKSETMTMQYGSGEDKKQFIAIRHAKTIKDNITMVLDVRVNEDRKATLMYQLNARW